MESQERIIAPDEFASQIEGEIQEGMLFGGI